MTVVDYFGYLHSVFPSSKGRRGCAIKKIIHTEVASAPFKGGFAAFREVASTPPQ